MAKKVLTIEKELVNHELGINQNEKLKVCAYCRVSSSKEEQLHSFDAQVSHYTNYIKNNPEWEFAGIYADEGISGKTKKIEQSL